MKSRFRSKADLTIMFWELEAPRSKSDLEFSSNNDSEMLKESAFVPEKEE